MMLGCACGCQSIGIQLLRCSEWFVVHWYIVARVFWVVARWLITGLSQKKNSYYVLVSMLESVLHSKCMGFFYSFLFLIK